ncbi:MAG: hypothetical protein AAFY20_17020 [Cyanobacteria bacterium J06639_14]
MANTQVSHMVLNRLPLQPPAASGQEVAFGATEAFGHIMDALEDVSHN